MAERIRKDVEKHKFYYDNENFIKVTVSAGVASTANEIFEKNNIVDVADKSLYFSKEHGRNRVTPYSKIHKEYE